MKKVTSLEFRKPETYWSESRSRNRYCSTSDFPLTVYVRDDVSDHLIILGMDFLRGKPFMIQFGKMVIIPPQPTFKPARTLLDSQCIYADPYAEETSGYTPCVNIVWEEASRIPRKKEEIDEMMAQLFELECICDRDGRVVPPTPYKNDLYVYWTAKAGLNSNWWTVEDVAIVRRQLSGLPFARRSGAKVSAPLDRVESFRKTPERNHGCFAETSRETMVFDRTPQ